MPAASTFLRLKRNPAQGPAFVIPDPVPVDSITPDLPEISEEIPESDEAPELPEGIEELPIMHGLRRPQRLPVGRPTNAEREPWLLFMERLMARGVLRPYHMSQLTGVKPNTCATWMAEIRQRWGLANTTADQLRRVAELLGETAEIGRIALESALQAKDGKSRGALLNVALKAGERRAALAGMDAKKVIEHHHTGKVERRTTNAVEISLGLSPGALAQIGQAAARQLTDAARSKMLESEVLDAEFTESPPPEPVPVQVPAVGDKPTSKTAGVSPVAPAAPAGRPRPKARPAGGSSSTTRR